MKLICCFIACSSLVAGDAATSSIGFVKAPGEVRVDGAAMRSNGTLFAGNLVETDAVRCTMQMDAGQIVLQPQSRARAFSERTVLEKGTEIVRRSASHTVEVATLSVRPQSKDSIVQVELTGPTHVSVATFAGGAEVRNREGVLVASLSPGTALTFDPQAAASSEVKLYGVVTVSGTGYVLKDVTSNVTVELKGAGLDKFVGKSVEVIGSTGSGAVSIGGASSLVDVVSIKIVHNLKKAAAGGAAAGGAAAAGLSTAAVGAIVAGVAVGGTLAGLAAAGTFSSSSSVSVK